MSETIREYIDANQERFLEELFEFLRIPSVSADPNYRDSVRQAADFARAKLEEAGLDTQVYETEGNPIVYAEAYVGEDRPTVLIYGHYDVQPVDPLSEWDHEPFEPYIEDGVIRGRGSSDDKGQLFMHIKALEFLHNSNQLAYNVKVILEGEEEIGSPNLEPFAREHADLLRADSVLISDTGMLSNEQPSIPIGLRGLCYLEVSVRGPERDLHSGLYGGAIANPANTLAELITSLKDEYGRVRVPGFYDTVRPPSEEEAEQMGYIPITDDDYTQDVGVPPHGGEIGYSAYEKTGLRPTLDVNGMWSGYTGEGAKTVLPAEAHAKISMRLVPDQDPDEIRDLVVNYLQAQTPAGVTVEVTPVHGATPTLVSTDRPEYQAGKRAYEQTFGVAPLPVRSGGSIPVVAFFSREMNMTPLLMGFGLDSDGAHGPNERFGVWNFYKGIETIPWFFTYLHEEVDRG